MMVNGDKCSASLSPGPTVFPLFNERRERGPLAQASASAPARMMIGGRGHWPLKS
ncbi:hypothetical protein Ancab_000039 [Ancistrocladus abbreviatus]